MGRAKWAALGWNVLQAAPFVSFAAFVGLIASLAQPPAKAQNSAQVDALLLPRREVLHVLGAGYQALLADYFWVQANYETGGAKSTRAYLNVYALVDLVTDLDPLFAYAYVFGGTVIPYNQGRETWTNTKEATRLVEKGLRFYPDHVYLRIVLAYQLSYFHKDYARAARMLEETSRLPGAPGYLSQLATRLYAQAGDFDAGMAFAQSLESSADDPDTREFYQHRIRELQLERLLEEIDRAAAAYRTRTGEKPLSVEALVLSRDLLALPSDPLGGRLYFGPDGRAYSSAQAHRLEAYDERKKMKKP